MSKNMNNKGKKAQEVQLDPSLYGYKPEEKVEINGQAFLQLIDTLDLFIRNAVEPVVEYLPAKEGETFPEWMARVEGTEKVYVPKKIHAARSLAIYLTGVHEDNVKSGKATHYSELNKKAKVVDFPVQSEKEEVEEKPVVKSE